MEMHACSMMYAYMMKRLKNYVLLWNIGNLHKLPVQI